MQSLSKITFVTIKVEEIREINFILLALISIVFRLDYLLSLTRLPNIRLRLLTLSSNSIVPLIPLPEFKTNSNYSNSTADIV